MSDNSGGGLATVVVAGVVIWLVYTGWQKHQADVHNNMVATAEDVAPSTASELPTEKSNVQSELDEAKSKISSLESDLETQKSQTEQLRQKVSELDDEVSTLRSRTQ